MNYEAKLEIHFHEPDRVSVLIKSAGEIDEQFGEVTLFAAYACRQMVNIGRGPVADPLAKLLIECSGSLTTLAGNRSPNGIRLVDHTGVPGKRRFDAVIQLGDGHYSFAMNARGFGLSGKGLGYYGPTSVTMLLQHLVEERHPDGEYLAALGMAAMTCGETFLNGKLTVPSQNKIALSAAMLGMTAVEQAKANARESSVTEAGSPRPEKSNSPARIEAIHDKIEKRDALAYDQEILALVERNGSRISADDWLNIFTAGSSRILFRDFSVALKTALHAVVVEQSKRLREQFPEAVPEESEELRQDVGGYVMNGYIVGRHLLGTHQEDLATLSSEADAQNAAAKLVAEAGRMPSTLMFRGGDGLKSFMVSWVDHRCKVGVYGRIADRSNLPMHLFLPIISGFGLAIAEHKITRS